MPRSSSTKSDVYSGRRIEHDEFVALLLRHDRRIRGFIATLLARFDEIDEVLQNVCLVAWKKLDQFSHQESSPDEEFVRWLCAIARYEVLVWRRSQNKPPQLLDEKLMDRLAAIQASESGYFEDRYRALVSCMQRLRSRDREMARQRYEAGVSVADIASSFGVGIDAIYKALTRVRGMLLDCVQRTVRREEYE